VTLRQLFYIMVARLLIEKANDEYARLGYLLRRARRAKLIPFESIADSGSILPSQLKGWEEDYGIEIDVSLAADKFELDPQMGQARRLAVWCEAAGMVSQLQRVAGNFGVHVITGGGFDSVTDKHGFAALVTKADEPFDVLHIGDLDDAGESIFTVVSEDVPAFASALGGDVTFTRLAVTEEQVHEYSLPHQPGKPIVQAEALPPDVLATLLRAAIEERLDLDRMAKVREQTDEIKAVTIEALRRAGLYVE
jgi:hypothetical protein